MTQLIIVVMSIVLTGMMVAASVSYIPGWVVDYERSSPLVNKGFCRLEAAVLGQISDGSGTVPTPTAAADGGLDQYFGAYYQFLPRAPDNGTWVYGTTTMGGKTLPYVCLDGATVSEGTYRALQRFGGSLPDTQFVIGANCGAGNAPEPAEYPAALAPTLLINPTAPYIASSAC